MPERSPTLSPARHRGRYLSALGLSLSLLALSFSVACVSTPKAEVTPLVIAEGTAGFIAQEDFLGVLAKKQTIAGVERCYQNTLARHPTRSRAHLTGVMDIQWIIETNGEVREVRVLKNTLHSSKMRHCMERQLRSWKFPPPKGGRVLVNYPFDFTPVYRDEVP